MTLGVTKADTNLKMHHIYSGFKLKYNIILPICKKKYTGEFNGN